MARGFGPFRPGAAGTAQSTPATSYIICTNPRSGSWLLAEGLARTGVAGYPREWFNVAEEYRSSGRWAIGFPNTPLFPTYLAYVLRCGSTPNGVLGIKLHYYQFAELPERLAAVEGLRDLPFAEAMARAFPNVRYLWLTRRDKLRQAISYYRAFHSGEWWQLDGGPTGGQSRSEGERFDAKAVHGIQRALAHNDRNWDHYFESNGISPHRVYYEDLAADYSGCIRDTLRWLALPGADTVEVAPPRLHRQADAKTDEWVALYAKDAASGATDEPSSVSEAPGDAASTPGAPPFPIESPIFDRTRAFRQANSEDWQGRVAENAAFRASLRRAQLLQRPNKVLAVLNALDSVARLASTFPVVEVRNDLPCSEFLDGYYARNRPVVLRGLMTGWPATSRWSPTYLREAIGQAFVGVIQMQDDGAPSGTATARRIGRRFADFVETLERGTGPGHEVLAPNNALLALPEARSLRGDLEPAIDYLTKGESLTGAHLWLAKAGTVLSLRHTQQNALFAQIRGVTRFHLIPATQWRCVYNEVANLSRVDCEKPNLDAAPRFRDASVLDVELHPGEVLFLPVAWWYELRCLDTNVAVTFTNFAFPNRYEWPESAIGADPAPALSKPGEPATAPLPTDRGSPS